MKILVLLIGLSLLLAIIFLGLFFLSVKKGQFDDLESPAFRLLNENKKTNTNSKLNT